MCSIYCVYVFIIIVYYLFIIYMYKMQHACAITCLCMYLSIYMYHPIHICIKCSMHVYAYQANHLFFFALFKCSSLDQFKTN